MVADVHGAQSPQAGGGLEVAEHRQIQATTNGRTRVFRFPQSIPSFLVALIVDANENNEQQPTFRPSKGNYPDGLLDGRA